MANARVNFPDISLFDILDFETPSTMEGVDSVLEKVKSRFGLLNINYRCHTFPGFDGDNSFLVTSYSKDWIDHYRDKKYFGVDPLVLRATRTFRPVDSTYLKMLSKKEMRIYNEGGEFGMGTAGVTIPVRHQEFGYGALFTVTTNDSVSEWQKRSAEMTSNMMLVANFVHMKYSDMQIPSASVDLNAVTSQEREALSWIAEGKSLSDIALEMRLPGEMVTAHLQSACDKLRAINSAHAVSKAIRAGIMF